MAKFIVWSIGTIGWLLVLSGATQAQPRNLDIYWIDTEGGAWIDTEGGAATLIVSPGGESLLVDTGWEVGDRDPKRIVAAAQQAGVKRIDYLVITHFHTDHVGGLRALAKMIPIGKCLDHGNAIEPENQKWLDAYMSVCADRRTIVKAGDAFRQSHAGWDLPTVAATLRARSPSHSAAVVWSVGSANGRSRRDPREKTKRAAGHLAREVTLDPSARTVTNVAGRGFCRAELRVCGRDAPDRR